MNCLYVVFVDGETITHNERTQTIIPRLERHGPYGNVMVQNGMIVGMVMSDDGRSCTGMELVGTQVENQWAVGKAGPGQRLYAGFGIQAETPSVKKKRKRKGE